MLCNFSTTFPDFVAAFLDQGRSLRRRFREETITDLMMGNLMAASGGKLIVEFPDEPATGADMEWNFVDRRAGTFFQILVQAKQAYGAGKIWSRHNYRELYHVSGSTPQAQTLCNAARTSGTSSYPLYLFYHPSSTIWLAHKSGVMNIHGVNVADGFFIEHLVKTAKGRRLRTHNRSLKALAPVLSPLSLLFCPSVTHPLSPSAYLGTSPVVFLVQQIGGRPSLGVPMPPDPHTVRQRVQLISDMAARDLASVTKSPTAEGAFVTLDEVPQVAKHIPDYVQGIIEKRGRRSEADRPLDRWRLTFLSFASQPQPD